MVWTMCCICIGLSAGLSDVATVWYVGITDQCVVDMYC